MLMHARILALLLGFFAELLIGWPKGLAHPIMGIGKLVGISEKWLRKLFPDTKRGQRAGGILMAAVLPVVFFFLSGALLFGCYRLHFIAGVALETMMCWSIFAAGSLRDAAMEVYNALVDDGVEAGRKAVSMIVGRDTNALSETGVIKATVETVAENLSDGVIAPMLFVFFGGAPLGFFYKTVNTMDSMVGYKNDTYQYFGTGAAKLDDFCNFIPARVSALLMIGCAKLSGLDAKNALRIFRRDRYNHASPNSAQTESVMAGALHVCLAGDACYFGKLYKKKTIGDPDREIAPDDIKVSCKYMVKTCIAAALTLSVLEMIVLGIWYLVR